MENKEIRKILDHELMDLLVSATLSVNKLDVEARFNQADVTLSIARQMNVISRDEEMDIWDMLIDFSIRKCDDRDQLENDKYENYWLLNVINY